LLILFYMLFSFILVSSFVRKKIKLQIPSIIAFIIGMSITYAGSGKGFEGGPIVIFGLFIVVIGIIYGMVALFIKTKSQQNI